MHNIAVIPGDGIGKEVMVEALKIIDLLNSTNSTKMNYKIFDWSSEYYLEHNQMMPDDGMEQLKEFDAILFGAIGDKRVPDDISIWQLIMPIRKQFQQYVNLRPVKLLEGVKSPLESKAPIDFVILRENTEGEYSDSGGILFQTENREMAIQNTIMTRQGIEQLAEYAHVYAKKHGYSKLTNATKSNVVIHTMKFWDEILEEIVEKHGELEYEKYFIDALVAYFVQRPESFEVVIASNLFGDILSDLGSAVVGGLGLAPSGNINPEKEFPSMFEAVHGSAPDIAGQGIANPIAQIWSVALMLDHLGEKNLHDVVLESIEDVLKDGSTLTKDIGGNATTAEVGDALVEKLKARL